MLNHKGVLKFTYEGNEKVVAYDLSNLAGTPFLCFKDKNGYHHSFIRLPNRWRSYVNFEPDWPQPFINAAFEKEYEAICKKYPGTFPNYDQIKSEPVKVRL